MNDRFGPDQLLRRLLEQPVPSAYCVAYSGGADSHCLLHALAALRERLARPLRAVHVDHRLQPRSAAWARHCATVAAGLGVPLEQRTVTVSPHPQGPEAEARAARYAVFAELLRPNEALLLAHHQDDQAETLLLRLLRGAGVTGMAAMPVRRPLGRGWLLRPLLDVSRRALRGYAERQGIEWVEDPSNQAPVYDRNYLRHEILPRLEQRWPAAAERLASAARRASEADELLGELAAEDLARIGADRTLPVAAVAALSPPRRRNLLRHWLRDQGVQPPEAARLEAGLRALLEAGADRQPELLWSGGRLLRHGGRLHLLPARLPPPPDEALEWDWRRPLEVPGAGRLELVPAVGGLDPARLAGGAVRVVFRRGGERCRVAGKGHSQALKKLLQEAGVPPWERERMPLIQVEGELAAVGELVVCEGFAAPAGAAGLAVRWEWRL